MAKSMHIAGLLPEAIAEHLVARGTSVRPDEARRILAHAVSPRAKAGRRKNPLSKKIQTAVTEAFEPVPLEVVERVTDPEDGFVRYLFRHGDGALSEAVRIPLHKPNAFSVCLSSQVGCAMGCDFCATGRLGLTRNMRAAEMVTAFARVRDDAPGRVTGAVFMGQGEPFHNYDEVIDAARVLSHPCGGCIKAEAITISTVGLVPQIQRFTREGHPYRLIVSVTSALPERRAWLLPVASRYPFEKLAEALRDYAAVSKQRVTLAWVLMSGVNTDAAEVRALQEHLGDVPLRINLIDVNDARADGYERAANDERTAFRDALSQLGAPVVRRYSGGAGKHAACGMLAATAG